MAQKGGLCTTSCLPLAAGVDVVSVAAWLGDTVQTVWQTYAHPDARR